MLEDYLPGELRDWVGRLRGRSGAQIRVMRRGDLDEVLRIVRLHDTDDYRAAERAFEHGELGHHGELHPDVGHFVVEDPEERRVVGVTGYYADDLEARGVFWLSWTYVNPFFRGRGYGGQLMDVVLEAVRRMGGRKMYLSTSSLPKFEAAVGFYERYGFRLEGLLSDYYQPGEDKLIFGREL